MSEKPKYNPFATPLNVRRMLTTTPPKLVHILPGFLAGNAGLLAGTGGTGKTTFGLQLAFAIASGGPLCGGLFDDVPPECGRSNKPGKVVMVAAEESAALISHRMHAVANHVFERQASLIGDEDPEMLLQLLEQHLHVHALLGKPRTLLLDENQEATDVFNRLVEACQGATLVLLDPLRQFHNGDENDSWNMTAVVQTAQMLAARTGAAVLMAHHTNRASASQGASATAGAARGSTALTDGVRWQLNISRVTGKLAKDYGIPEDNEAGFVRVDIAKSNYLAPYRTRVLQRGAGGVFSLVNSKVRPGLSEPKAPSRVVKYAKRVAA